MLYEPTTLAAVTRILAVALRKDYGIDPAPIFAAADIPLEPSDSLRQRYPLSKIRALWRLARDATGDAAIGLKTGKHAHPTQFYAFGFSWMASSTLLGALQRLTRYHQLVSTASIAMSLTETDDCYVLTTVFPDESRRPPKEGVDCGMTALLTLCDHAAEQEVCLTRVDLTCAETVHPDDYRSALRAPIRFDSDANAFYFDKITLLRRLQHGAPDIAKATDRIAEQYIETLEPHKVASQVRQLLIALLPSGKTDQALVSNRLNRSVSTLQRQLQLEGSSYRDVLESTRRSLAENYLRDRKHSQAQIAYLLGFSDQSNFSRAFKRWTGVGPNEFQEHRQ